MFRTHFQTLFYLSALFLFSNFQCGDPECEYGFFFLDWQSTWLDNSGAEPLSSAGPVPRLAFGIRLSTQLSSDGLDTLKVDQPNGCFLIPNQPITQLNIITENGFDSIAAGENINQRFRLRVSTGGNLNYLPLDTGISFLNSPTVATPYHIDLLMTEPPSQSGAYRFSVKIMFDSMTTQVSHDTLINLPTVLLL